ncbi:MAG TPA: alpha-ketoacid dehydrogenase subunit beta [Dehalococcoidales bacterium]|nr:alpha-ketoacid dehydrogenase subunit beta [Dehalococcoidales bacterium]
MREINFRQAIGEALDEEMERDPRVFIIGEDVGVMGGLMGEIGGLYLKYGIDRVRDTPLSEAAILGAAIGAAITGMRPVARMRFGDFLGVAWDEIMNQMTKMRYMFGGKIKMPLTMDALTGAGRRSAAQHSQSIEGMLMCIPGLKIVLPSNAYDAKGLLKTAIRDDNPVMFFEHKLIMWTSPKSEVPEGEYLIPFGQANIKREGSDVTVVATANMVTRALNAAEKLQQEKGISLEVIDPRTIVPFDKETVLKSVSKTGRLVIFTEECETGSFAGQVAAIVADEGFDYLDAPIKRVNAPDTPVPYGVIMEDFWIPNEDKLIKAVNEIT